MYHRLQSLVSSFMIHEVSCELRAAQNRKLVSGYHKKRERLRARAQGGGPLPASLLECPCRQAVLLAALPAAASDVRLARAAS